MAARGSKSGPREGYQTSMKFLSEGTGRAYTYWAVGVMISALGLKPTSISAAGWSLSIEHPEVIQGVLYLAAFWKSVSTLSVFQRGFNPFASRQWLRLNLWGLLPKGTRSFRGKTHSELVELRTRTRRAITAWSWLWAIPLIILPILLLLFKGRAMATAFAAFFTSTL
jgi:hypothetical protein